VLIDSNFQTATALTVIASEAKQSMPQHEERKNGLLRFARNDG
jgi:hypothetical protein